MLYTIEGLRGSGKTTYAEVIAKASEALGHKVWREGEFLESDIDLLRDKLNLSRGVVFLEEKETILNDFSSKVHTFLENVSTSVLGNIIDVYLVGRSLIDEYLLDLVKTRHFVSYRQSDQVVVVTKKVQGWIDISISEVDVREIQVGV